jgi:hypothetical protein
VQNFCSFFTLKEMVSKAPRNQNLQSSALVWSQLHALNLLKTWFLEKNLSKIPQTLGFAGPGL